MSSKTTPSVPRNVSMNRAKAQKNNEFYTQFEDIKAEIIEGGCYMGCFQDKTVLCNCNDLTKGDFKCFFMDQFDTLGLRKLITVSYGVNAAVAVYDGHRTLYIPLAGDGDFRSEEGIKILRHVDVVVTNPPFSLFRAFILMLMEYDKPFLIVGDVVNEITCKDIFPLYMNGQVWFGHTKVKSFQTPEGPRKFGYTGWYTNMGVPPQPKPLILTMQYFGNEAYYPAYDNYEAISVDKVKDIPADFYGEIGVPGSYLLVHDPEQFEIIGTSGILATGVIDKDGVSRNNPGRFYINGRRKPDRVVIQRKKVNNAKAVLRHADLWSASLD